MRLENQRQSTNIEDRRGMRMRGPAGIGGGGIGMILIVLLVSWLTGTNPLTLFQLTGGLPGGGGPAVDSVPAGPAADDPQSRFIGAVLGSLEDTWTDVFARAGDRYQPAVLVLFSDSVQSACGGATSASGPFYCPADQKVYLDLSFFRELDQQFGAPGDFAQAYVVAHEVGHHLQTILGVNAQVSRLQQQARSQAEANQLSVRLELQADCFAGIWGHHAARKDLLEPGDVDEGLAAAAAIGDDRLQSRGQGRVVPESFTHGTSAQRAEWLRRGLSSGRIEDCDTFRR